MSGRAAREPVIKIEHAAAPGAHGIVRRQDLEIADRAGHWKAPNTM